MPYRHLTENERYVISHLQSSFSIRKIAQRQNRHHTTISRELKRNGPKSDCTAYNYDRHLMALARRQQPRPMRRQNNQRLVNYVESKLKQEWSPEEIATKIRIDYSEDDQMRISPETIYRWVYLDSSVDGILYQRLRRKRKRRCKQCQYGTGRRFKDTQVNIDQRPAVVTARLRFGDWEGDTVHGKPRSGCIDTMVERKSRYLVAAKLEDKKATTLTEKCVNAFVPISRVMRQTPTLDNGSEFADFKELAKKTRIPDSS
jgi:transposase, IS30 family